MSSATINKPSLFSGTATKGGGGEKFETCPPGNYPGRLVAIIDLGTHDGEYQGEPQPDQRFLYLAWELPTIHDKAGNCFVLGETYSTFVEGGGFVFGEKNKLRKMMEGWRGKAFEEKENVDPLKMLSLACMVNVVAKKTKKGNAIAIIDGVKPFPMGLGEPGQVHESTVYHTSMGQPPVVLWLPRVYWFPSAKLETIDDIISFSKERTGQPIGNGKPADTPYSTSAPKEAATTAGADASDVPF